LRNSTAAPSEGHVTFGRNRATFCILPRSTNMAAFFVDSAICSGPGLKRPGIRGSMKLLDICVIGLVSIVILSRFPSPLNSLRCDLISKTRLTALSAICDLFGLLVACDYVASRFSQVSQKHPGWTVAEMGCLIASGLFLGSAFRAFLSRLFSRKSSRTQPVKAEWHPNKIRLTR
jgi:hypothetical protein